MRKLAFVLAAAALLTTGPAGAFQPQRRPVAAVELIVTDSQGRAVDVATLPPRERQRVGSLRNAMQQWGNQQGERLSITIRCTYPPLRCEITISL